MSSIEPIRPVGPSRPAKPAVIDIQRLRRDEEPPPEWRRPGEREEGQGDGEDDGAPHVDVRA